MLKKDIVITLDNELEYGVTSVEIINGIEYALMINIKNRNDLKICKVLKESNEIAVTEMNGEDLVNVYPVFYDKARTYLEQFMK